MNWIVSKRSNRLLCRYIWPKTEIAILLNTWICLTNIKSNLSSYCRIMCIWEMPEACFSRHTTPVLIFIQASICTYNRMIMLLFINTKSTLNHNWAAHRNDKKKRIPTAVAVAVAFLFLPQLLSINEKPNQKPRRIQMSKNVYDVDHIKNILLYHIHGG